MSSTQTEKPDLTFGAQPTVIDGSALRDWLVRSFAEFQVGHWSMCPRPGQDCVGPSQFMALTEEACYNAPDITSDPKSLARKDIAEHQRGDYHHLYVTDVVAFAVARGVLEDDYLLVHHKW